MELTIAFIIGAYIAFATYIISSLFRYLKLPLERRQKMAFTQRILFFYGLYKTPKKGLEDTASGALSTFQDAWHNMEEVFKKFGTTFEQRRNELQDAETNLTKLQEEIREQSNRLKALTQLTPEAANEVIQAIKTSGRSSLWQQVIVSAVFFVLGSVTTLAIT